MRVTAKEFAELEHMPLKRVKRYCHEGIFSYHRVGRIYSIDYEESKENLKKLDAHQAELDGVKLKKTTSVVRRHKKIKNDDDFLASLDKLLWETA